MGGAATSSELHAPVFDFGGVMTTSTMPLRVGPVAAEVGLSTDALDRGFAKHRLAYDAGRISMREFYVLTARDEGLTLTEDALERLVEADRAFWLYRNERTLEWMKSLKAQGRRIGILTNMGADFAPLFLDKFRDFVELADAMVISGLEGIIKPQREIYDMLRERISLPADRLVFIDDTRKNCDGAVAAGWHAIHFSSNDQVESDFEKISARSIL